MTTRSSARHSIWPILLIIGLAAILRLWRLDQFPPGLSVDEAYNLLDAQRILAGERPLFLPDNAGREALYSYWQASLITLLGPGALALRVASALIGIATVAATVWCLSGLPWPQARLTATVAAAILAGLFWHVLFSRFGIRAISMPLLAALMFGWLWRGMFGGRWRDFALAGAALGIALYTGTAARVLPLAPILSLGLLAWVDRGQIRRYLGGLALLFGVAALVVLPLAAYFLQFPDQFTSHLSEVAVGPLEWLANGLAVLGMFNLRGDGAWWRNLGGRPVFDPLMGMLFLAGLAVLLRDLFTIRSRIRDTSADHTALSAFLVLLWLAVMLIPTLAADGAPNFSRAIGILPLICVIPARALVLVYAWLSQRRPTWAMPALVATLVLSLAWTTWDYFGVFANRPEPYYAYDADKVAAGQALRAAAEEGQVYTPPGLAGHATVRATIQGVPIRTYDPTRGVVLADGVTSLYIWQRDEAEAIQGWAMHTLSAARIPVADAYGQHLLTGYRLTTPAPGDVRAVFGLRAGQVRFGNAIGLSGYALMQPLTPSPSPLSGRGGILAPPFPLWERGQGGEGKTPLVMLMWNALAPLDRNWTVFVHFVDAQGVTQAQADSEPLGGSYPTTAWAVGERILEWRVPNKPLPPGTYRVRVGWYDRLSGERLPLPNAADSAFELGGVEIPG